jgi:hypothetical protein
LKKQDNNISSHLERIANDKELVIELKRIDERLFYEALEVESIVGKKKFSDLYLPQTLTERENPEATYQAETFLQSLLEGEKHLHLLSAFSGSGKSFFVQRCMQLMNDTRFLYRNGRMNTQTQNINLNQLSSEETPESFAEKFELLAHQQNILLIDALDEQEADAIKIFKQLLQTPGWKERYQIKVVIASRYFDQDWERMENTAHYGLQQEQDFVKYVETYKKFLSNPLQEQRYIALVQQVAHQLKSDFSPLLVGMLVGLVDNKEIRKKLAKNSLQRSDIYEAFLEEYLLREEKNADKVEDGTEVFYDPLYNESKIKLLGTLVEQEIYNTGNDLYTSDIRANTKMQNEGANFLQFFPAFLEKLSPEEKKLFNTHNFPLFLKHLQNIGFLTVSPFGMPLEGGLYDFGLNHLHKSFYDYIGYTALQAMDLEEYFQNFLNIVEGRANNHPHLHHYLTFRFFNEKTELLPFLEKLQYRRDSIRKNSEVLSDFLFELF